VLSVRLSLCRAALAASFVFSALSASVLGQAIPGGPGVARPAVPAAAPAAAHTNTAPVGTTVVVLDVAYVFKNFQRFNGQMNDIKKDIEAFEAFVKGEQQKFVTKREELQQFKPGSLEYKQKEEELARLQSDLQVQVGLKRKEFLEQEARVYYRSYREIEQVVAVFAQRNRIGLVLRFNGDEMKEDDRASVLQGVNRAVVYQYNLDITQHIVDELNRFQTAVRPTPAPGPVVPGPRPPVPQQR
jgi:Skp family chaperone for outer membrane proteins